MSVNIPFNLYKIYQTGVVPTPSYSLEGKNISVLCVLPEQQQQYHDFLTKVLSAAKIAENTVQVIFLKDRDPLPVAEMGWLNQLDHILCFGIPLKRLMMQIPYRNYHPVRIMETTLHPLPDLSVIEPSRDEKQKLWELLKNTFVDG